MKLWPLLSLLSLLSLLIAGEARAQSTLGFGEVRASLFPGASGDAWQLVERVRPTLEAELAPRVKLVATLEAGFDQGRDLTTEFERTLSESDFGPLLDAGQCRWPTHENRLLRIDDAGDYLDIDRLYLDVYAGPVDIRVGRQALNWGSAQFFNPTDPFPEVLLAEPWRPRRGVNAIRASVPFGEANDASLVVASNDVFTQVRAAGRVRLNWSGIDAALVGAWRGENGLVGLDLRGTFGVGWWIEAAYVLGDGRHEELAIGADYSFPIFERATLFVQYYRNGAGSSDPSAYQRVATGIAGPECSGLILPLGGGDERDPFAPFTVGRDYLVLGSSLAIDPELTINASVLQNLNDGTGIVVPTVSYAVLDWLDLAFSAQVPYALWGSGGELKPRREDLRLAIDTPTGRLDADLSGLVADATITFWTRASF